MTGPTTDHDHDDAAYAVTQPVDLRSMLAEERAAEPPAARRPKPPQLRPGFRTDDQRAALERGDSRAAELLQEFRFSAPRALHHLAYGHLHPWFAEPAWKVRWTKMTATGMWLTHRLSRDHSAVALTRQGAQRYGGVAPNSNVDTARRGWLRSMAWMELQAVRDYYGPQPVTTLLATDGVTISPGLDEVTKVALRLAKDVRNVDTLQMHQQRCNVESGLAAAKRLPLHEATRRNNFAIASLAISTKACAKDAPSTPDVTRCMVMYRKLSEGKLKLAHDYVRYASGRRLWLLVDDPHRSLEDQVDDLAACAFGAPDLFRTPRLSNEVLFRPVDKFSVWDRSKQVCQPHSHRCEKMAQRLTMAGFVLVDSPVLHFQAKGQEKVKSPPRLDLLWPQYPQGTRWTR